MLRVPLSVLLLLAVSHPAIAQTPAQPVAKKKAARRPGPTRDPNTPGYVKAKELPDGQLPSATENGNFIIGPTHTPAALMTPKNPLDGKVSVFTMESKDSNIYPGIV